MSTTTTTLPDSRTPLLTTIAFRVTVATCVLFFLSPLVMSVVDMLGKLLFLAGFFGWFVASWCGLLGIPGATPKRKAVNIFLFSLVGPMMAILLLLVVLSLPNLLP